MSRLNLRGFFGALLGALGGTAVRASDAAGRARVGFRKMEAAYSTPDKFDAFLIALLNPDPEVQRAYNDYRRNHGDAQRFVQLANSHWRVERPAFAKRAKAMGRSRVAQPAAVYDDVRLVLAKLQALKRNAGSKALENIKSVEDVVLAVHRSAASALLAFDRVSNHSLGNVATAADIEAAASKAVNALSASDALVSRVREAVKNGGVEAIAGLAIALDPMRAPTKTEPVSNGPNANDLPTPAMLAEMRDEVAAVRHKLDPEGEFGAPTPTVDASVEGANEPIKAQDDASAPTADQEAASEGLEPEVELPVNPPAAAVVEETVEPSSTVDEVKPEVLSAPQEPAITEQVADAPEIVEKPSEEPEAVAIEPEEPSAAAETVAETSDATKKNDPEMSADVENASDVVGGQQSEFGADEALEEPPAAELDPSISEPAEPESDVAAAPAAEVDAVETPPEVLSPTGSLDAQVEPVAEPDDATPEVAAAARRARPTLEAADGGGDSDDIAGAEGALVAGANGPVAANMGAVPKLLDADGKPVEEKSSGERTESAGAATVTAAPSGQPSGTELAAAHRKVVSAGPVVDTPPKRIVPQVPFEPPTADRAETSEPDEVPSNGASQVITAARAARARRAAEDELANALNEAAAQEKADAAKAEARRLAEEAEAEATAKTARDSAEVAQPGRGETRHSGSFTPAAVGFAESSVQPNMVRADGADDTAEQRSVSTPSDAAPVSEQVSVTDGKPASVEALAEARETETTQQGVADASDSRDLVETAPVAGAIEGPGATATLPENSLTTEPEILNQDVSSGRTAPVTASESVPAARVEQAPTGSVPQSSEVAEHRRVTGAATDAAADAMREVLQPEAPAEKPTPEPSAQADTAKADTAEEKTKAEKPDPTVAAGYGLLDVMVRTGAVEKLADLAPRLGAKKAVAHDKAGNELMTMVADQLALGVTKLRLQEKKLRLQEKKLSKIAADDSKSEAERVAAAEEAQQVAVHAQHATAHVKRATAHVEKLRAWQSGKTPKERAEARRLVTAVLLGAKAYQDTKTERAAVTKPISAPPHPTAAPKTVQTKGRHFAPAS